MRAENFSEMSAKEQAKLGLPDGFNFFTPGQFEGLNQSDSRIGMPDSDLFYIENLINIGNYNMRALWDVGTALYTATNRTIVSFFFYSIGTTPYAAVFFSDGTALQVDTTTGATLDISTVPNTFYTSGSSLPACAQWGAQYLIITNNITANTYYVWNGSALFFHGSISPVVDVTSGGSGYSSVPSATPFGGSGSGISVTPTISGGSVVGLTINTPGSGYLPGEFVQFQFSGGGSDTSAVLNSSVSSNTVGHIQIIDPGSGYTPGTYALGFSGGGGSGAAGTYTVDSSGTVVSTVLTNQGSAYTATPTVAFSSGGGSGAAAVAILDPGVVTSVAVSAGGSGYTTTPTIAFMGGGGAGAEAVAVLLGGAIDSVTVTNGGTGYTSAPAVVVQSGVNEAASANAVLMPFGVSGNSLETFQSRVWIAHPFQAGSTPTGGTFQVSAPGSFTDFATSSGGLSFSSTDSFLRYQYTNLKQSNGYLYPFGDSSVSVASNVQTSGNPPVTTFNYQNTDPQVGTVWRDTCQDFSRTILFSNPIGVWGLYGGAVTKISKKLDNLFTNAVFPPTNGALLPSAAVANVFSRRIFCSLMTFKDPFTQATVNKMICWDEKDWFIASQTPALIYIGTQEYNSNLIAWGTDGRALYPLFSSPSASLSKKLATKLYGVNTPVVKRQAFMFAIAAQDVSSAQTGLSFNVSIDTNYLSPDTNAYSYPLPTISFKAPVPTYPTYITSSVEDVYGMNIGATLTSTSPDFTINSMGLGYIDYTAELALAGG